MLLIEELGRHGVETRFLNAPSSATAEDQLLVQFQGMIAEYERAQILERSRRGKRHRARTGEISVMGGAPYGYHYLRKRDDAPASYVVVEAEARVVRDIYDHYTVTGWSIEGICRWLNEQGVATRKAGARWGPSTVRQMLRNPAYRGTACFGKTRIVRGVARQKRVTRTLRMGGAVPRRDSAPRERPREEWIEIPVPAIVDEPTFARAQELLHENKVHARRRTIEPSLVQGLVSCRKCGYSFSRISTRSTARRIQYYRCIGSDRWRHLAGPRCDARPVRQDLLDEVVWTEVLRLLEEPALIQQELDRRLAAAQAADPKRTRTQAVERDLARVGKTIERLLTAYQEDLVSLDCVARPTTRADAVAASTRADAATGAERAGGTDSRPRRASASRRNALGVSDALAGVGRDARHRGAATDRAAPRQGGPRQRRRARDSPLYSRSLGTATNGFQTERPRRRSHRPSKLPFAFRE